MVGIWAVATPANRTTRAILRMNVLLDRRHSITSTNPILRVRLPPITRPWVPLSIIIGTGFAPPLVASGYAARSQFHHHHQVVQPVPAPASQPCHVPITEARTQCHGRAKAKELGFQLH